MNNAIQINNSAEKTNFLKISRTLNIYGFLGFGLIMLIQIGLWYSHLWHPIVLSSFLLFGFVWIKYTQKYGIQISITNKKKLTQLINSNFNNVSYQPCKHLLKRYFIKSELYDFSSFIFNGNNLLKSEGWSVSNLQVSLPLSKKNQLTIFEGIFAEKKTQNTLDGNVIIKPLPVKDKTVIPDILQHLIHRYYTPKVKSILTGNTTFDEKFEVFASSDVTQHNIITNKTIKNIIDLDETINYYFGKEYMGIELSYSNNNLYIGIKGIKLFSLNGSSEAYNAQKHLEIINQIINL